MPIIVEDGTGLSNAESYASVAEFKAYCDARGYSYTALADPAGIEAKLRMAADYIDSAYRFKGTRLVSTQALEFPRDGLTDWSGMSVTGVPARVRNAQCELAAKGVTETAFFQDNDKVGIKSETVGPLSTTYADSASSSSGSISKQYEVVTQMLNQYTRDKTMFEGLPFSGTDGQEPFFSAGMHDA